MTRRRSLVGVLVTVLVLGALVVPANAEVRRGDSVYIPRRPTLIAIDRESGERKWRVVLSEKPGRIDLAYADDALVVVLEVSCKVADSSPELIAFDASTGDERWRVELGKGFGASIDSGQFGFGYGGSTVVVAKQTRETRPSPDPRLQGLFTEVVGVELMGFDPETGEQQWDLRRDGYATAGGGRGIALLSTQANVIPIPGAGRAAPTQATLLAIDRRTGKTVWKYSVAKDELEIVSTHVGSDTVGLVVPGLDNSANPDASDPPFVEERALDLSTGQELWRHSAIEGPLFDGLERVLGPIVVRSEYLESTYRHTAYDVRTRKELWHREDTFVVSEATVPNAVLMRPSDATKSSDESILVLEARSGEVRWNRPIQKQQLYGEVVADAGLIVFNGYNDGDERALTAFDAHTGEPRWTAKIPDTVNGIALADNVYATDSCYDSP